MRTARDGPSTPGPKRASARSARRPASGRAATERRGRRPLPPRTSRLEERPRSAPSLTRRDAPSPFGSRDSARPAVPRARYGRAPEPLPRERRLSSRNRTRLGRSRKPLPPARRSGGLRRRHDGADGHDSELDPVGSVANDRRRAFRFDAGPGTRSMTRIDSSVTSTGRRATRRRTGRRAGWRASPRRPARGDRASSTCLPARGPTRASTSSIRLSEPRRDRLATAVGDKRCCAKVAARRRARAPPGPTKADRRSSARGRPGDGDPRLDSPSIHDVHAPRSRSRGSLSRSKGRSPPTRPRERTRGRRRARGTTSAPARDGGPPDGRDGTGRTRAHPTVADERSLPATARARATRGPSRTAPGPRRARA
jgi:hypothetical protein